MPATRSFHYILNNSTYRSIRNKDITSVIDSQQGTLQIYYDGPMGLISARDDRGAISLHFQVELEQEPENNVRSYLSDIGGRYTRSIVYFHPCVWHKNRCEVYNWSLVNEVADKRAGTAMRAGQLPDCGSESCSRTNEMPGHSIANLGFILPGDEVEGDLVGTQDAIAAMSHLESVNDGPFDIGMLSPILPTLDERINDFQPTKGVRRRRRRRRYRDDLEPSSWIGKLVTCLFWVVLLVGSYTFDQWICGESDYSCDAACSRNFHYNLPAETMYFHHGTRPSASELSDEINRIRAWEHEGRMRLKRKQANEREFRCSLGRLHKAMVGRGCERREEKEDEDEISVFA
jgi:hypothetical protein